MSIIVNGLNKAYGDKPVLENFSAEIPEGFTCVIGRSGSGKTTLARLLAGLEKPDSGEMRVRWRWGGSALGQNGTDPEGPVPASTV